MLQVQEMMLILGTQGFTGYSKTIIFSLMYQTTQTQKENMERLVEQTPMVDGPFRLSRPVQRQVKGGNWTQGEITKLAAFIRFYESHFLADFNNWKSFKAMAAFVQTRNPNQCRIYHLKLNKVFTYSHQFLNQIALHNPNFDSFYLEVAPQLSKNSEQFSLQKPFFKLQEELVERGKGEKEIITKDSYRALTRNQYGNPINGVPTPNFNASATNMGYFENDTKAQEWQECHLAFCNWANKLQSLMLKYPPDQ